MASKRYDLPHLAFFQGFEAAARTLSFTKAVEELFITQSAVSRQIKALEDHLGLKLFERRPRSLTLTENGQALHPDIDVRISATTDMINLERSLIDLAIRYCKPESVPEGALKLFGEEVIPVCSRALLRDKARPLKRPQDLAHHTLLHFDYAGIMYMDWGTWLTALGIGDLKPAGALHFSQYEQMIQAAISGQGVAL